MNKQGIGWFKLDLVTYPDNTCFINTTIKDTSFEVAIEDRKIRIKTCIQKDYKEMTDINKESNKQVILHKKDKDAVKIEKTISISTCIKKKSEVSAE